MDIEIIPGKLDMKLTALMTEILLKMGTINTRINKRQTTGNNFTLFLTEQSLFRTCTKYIISNYMTYIYIQQQKEGYYIECQHIIDKACFRMKIFPSYSTSCTLYIHIYWQEMMLTSVYLTMNLLLLKILARRHDDHAHILNKFYQINSFREFFTSTPSSTITIKKSLKKMGLNSKIQQR